MAISSITTSGPFVLASNSCGTTSLAASTDCQLQVEFAPTATGPATGVLTHGGRRGNADGAIDRHRSGATDRHAVGHVVDVRGHNHRTVFVSRRR